MQLAEVVAFMQVKAADRDVGKSCCSAFAESHTLEQLCALRLQIAGRLPQVQLAAQATAGATRDPPAASGQGGKAAHGGTKLASSGKSSLDCLSICGRTDGRLLDIIETTVRDHGTACHFSLRGIVLHERTLSQSHELWPCLQHPAVQCFLLWQLVAPGQPPGSPVCSGHYPPEGQDEGRSWHSHTNAMSALCTAATCWEAALRCELPLCPAGAAVPVTGGQEPAGQGNWRAGVGGGVSAGGLPCIATQVYGMVMRGLMRCQRQRAQDDINRALDGNVDLTGRAAVGALTEALLHMPPAAASRRLRGVWRAVLPRVPGLAAGEDRAHSDQAGQLLCFLTHITPPAQRGNGAPAATAAEQDGYHQRCPPASSGLTRDSPPQVAYPAAVLSMPYVLSCGLEEGLIPALEGSVRSCLQQAMDSVTYLRLAYLLDLALRRPGCWPAMLAYGDPQRAAALVITLGKATQRLVDPSALPPGSPDWVTLAGTVLNMQLLALLEQLTPQVTQVPLPAATQPGLAGGSTEAAVGATDAACSEGTTVPRGRLLGLVLNHALRGTVDGRREEAGCSSRWAPGIHDYRYLCAGQAVQARSVIAVAQAHVLIPCSSCA